MPVYFDTSALVKRYDPNEAGAARVAAFFATAQIVFTSALTPVEVISAFRQKQRSGAFTAAQFNLAVQDFQAHSPLEYALVQPQPSTFTTAQRLVLAYKLRAYDAVHVATALTIVSAAQIPPQQLEFWTSDQDQVSAAAAEGLAVTLV